MRKPTMLFANRSDTNWSVPSQEMARSAKFWTYCHGESAYIIEQGWNFVVNEAAPIGSH